MCIGHSAMDIMAEKILPYIQSPVVLFSGSRDITLPIQRTCGGEVVDGDCKYGDYSAKQKKSIRTIIDSPMIERWMAENLVYPHPAKMAPLPLGFFPAHCQNDGVKPLNSFDAEADLEWGVCSNVWSTIRGVGKKPLTERPLVMACSGHVRNSPDYNHRRALAAQCAEGGEWNSFAVAPKEETDFETFLNFLAGTSFTACAHGGGSDPAPKAFEAIAAGSIPIITSSALDGAYRKLPVVVIDSWDDPSLLTKEKLAEWRDQLAPHFEPQRRSELERRLTLDFWFSESLRGTSAAPAAPASKEADDWWVDARAMKRAPMAILHVGPHKMGSTSLQAGIAKFKNELAKDGFDVPGVKNGRQRLAGSAAQVRCSSKSADFDEATLLFPSPLTCKDRDVKGGWRMLRKAIDHAHSRGRSVLLSAEDFDLPEADLEQLADALHDFNLTTVVMLRPFFEWISSVHGQVSGRDLGGVRNSGQEVHHLLQCVSEEEGVFAEQAQCKGLAKKNLSEVSEQYTPLVDWLTNDTISRYMASFTPSVLKRYRLIGGTLMQLLSRPEEKNSLYEDFFCRGWSPHTCAAVRRSAARGDAPPQENWGGGEDAVRSLEVAVGAMRAGWLPGNVSALEAMRRIKGVISAWSINVPLRCLPGPMQKALIDATTNSETDIFTRAGAKNREVQIDLWAPDKEMDAFASASNSTLCSTDNALLLKSEELSSAIRLSVLPLLSDRPMTAGEKFVKTKAAKRAALWRRKRRELKHGGDPALDSDAEEEDDSVLPPGVPDWALSTHHELAAKKAAFRRTIDDGHGHSAQSQTSIAALSQINSTEAAAPTGVGAPTSAAPVKSVWGIENTPPSIHDDAYDSHTPPTEGEKVAKEMMDATFLVAPPAVKEEGAAQLAQHSATFIADEAAEAAAAKRAERKHQDSRRVRIVSVHVGSSDWVPMQAGMVKKYVDLPFSLYTTVNDGTEDEMAMRWKEVTGEFPAYVAAHGKTIGREKSTLDRCMLNADPSCDHGVQLHHLAKKACAKDVPSSDPLLFLDADAWPLTNISGLLELLEEGGDVDLIAVRRAVEGMALWPHPSFALTTCGTWVSGKHSWSQPPADRPRKIHEQMVSRSIFAQSQGQLCHNHEKLDTGAPLWPTYNDSSTNWVALDRMNKLDLDPLFYAVYGLDGTPVAYHQGAGSRQVATSKVVPGAQGIQGYEDSAFKLSDLVLEVLGQPNGTEELVELLVRPHSHPLYLLGTNALNAINDAPLPDLEAVPAAPTDEEEETHRLDEAASEAAMARTPEEVAGQRHPGGHPVASKYKEEHEERKATAEDIELEKELKEKEKERKREEHEKKHEELQKLRAERAAKRAAKNKTLEADAEEDDSLENPAWPPDPAWAAEELEGAPPSALATTINRARPSAAASTTSLVAVSAPAAAALAAQAIDLAAAAAGPAAGGMFPPALRAWVERSFAQCSSDEERTHVETRFLQRVADGNLDNVDWDNEPLVIPGHRSVLGLRELAPLHATATGADALEYAATDLHRSAHPPLTYAELKPTLPELPKIPRPEGRAPLGDKGVPMRWDENHVKWVEAPEKAQAAWLAANKTVGTTAELREAQSPAAHKGHGRHDEAEDAALAAATKATDLHKRAAPRPYAWMHGPAGKALGRGIMKTCLEVRHKLLTGYKRGCLGRAEELCQVRLGLQLVHIPKTGGTAIEMWGRTQPSPIRLGRFRELWPQGRCYWGCRDSWQPCSAWHLPPAIFRANGAAGYGEASDNMCVVRNPFDRAASQVAWLLRNRAHQDPSVCDARALNAHVHKLLNEMKDSLATVEEKFPHLAPEDMLLADAKCQAGESNSGCQSRVVQPAFREDCHWLPQWMYVQDTCEHQLRTESLETDFKSLMEGFGLDAELPHANERNVSACPIDASMLDEESEALIREVYAKDFELYGYPTSIERPEPLALAMTSEEEPLEGAMNETWGKHGKHSRHGKHGKLQQLNSAAAQCSSAWHGAVDLALEMPPSNEHRAALKQHQDVTFVQVSETWGTSTANWVAQLAGAPRRLSKRQHDKVAITTVHGRPVFRRPGLKSTHYLVSLRDPIDRFLSAYQAYACKMGYRNSSLCHNQRVDEGSSGPTSSMKPARTMAMVQEFFECFPKVADLAEQLDAETACGAQARSLLTFYQRDSADEMRRAFVDEVTEHHRQKGRLPKEYPPFRSHMLMGTCFYVGGMLKELARNGTSVYVLETDDDLLGVPEWLGQAETGPPPKTGQLPDHSRMLSDRGRELLRKALAPEFFANYMVRRMSVNKGGNSSMSVG